MCVLNMDGAVIALNQSAANLIGALYPSWVGMSFFAMIAPEHRDLGVAHFKRCMQGGVERYDAHMLGPGGQRMDMQVTQMPIAFGQQWVGAYTILQDVTVFRDMQRSLLNSQMLLSYAKRMARFGIWELDPIYRVLKWSDEIFGIFGLNKSADGFIPLVSVLDMIHPEDRAAVEQSVADAVLELSYDVRYRIVRPDGEERFVRSRQEAIYEGKLMGTLQDISEWGRAQYSVQQADKLASLAKLASGVAHEIRNPLTSIKGFVRLFEASFSGEGLANAAANREKYLQIINDEVLRIERIIAELVSLVTAQSVMECVNLPVLLQGLIADSKDRLEQANIHVKTIADPRAILIRCEPGQLKRALANLVQNAIDAMPGGGILRIVTATAGDQVQIQVIDQGRGVQPDELPKLGEPFYSTKEDGTGLSLLVSRQVASLHGGSLTFASEPDRGFTATMTIPL
ncbi:MAG: ATP-binding protein [Bacilli bacterium]